MSRTEIQRIDITRTITFDAPEQPFVINGDTLVAVQRVEFTYADYSDLVSEPDEDDSVWVAVYIQKVTKAGAFHKAGTAWTLIEGQTATAERLAALGIKVPTRYSFTVHHYYL